MHIGYPQGLLLLLVLISIAVKYPFGEHRPWLRDPALLDFAETVVGSGAILLIVWWGGFFG